MKNLTISQTENIVGGGLCSFSSGFFTGMAIGSLLYGNAPGAAFFTVAGVLASAYCDGIRSA